MRGQVFQNGGREKEGTVTVRFRKVQFTAAAASQFEPPAGFSEYADMQQISIGPGVKYMKENHTSVKAPGKVQTPAASPARPAPPKAAPAAKKK